jgi:hypothetical protein
MRATLAYCGATGVLVPRHHDHMHLQLPSRPPPILPSSPIPTMADTVPGKLKVLQLAPFAKRAAQLERFKPIVTYWREYRRQVAT